MQDFLNFIANLWEIDPSEISPDTAFGQHKKWDSLMHMRMVMEIELKYDVEIPIDEVPNLKTLKDFYNFIEL